MATNIYSSTPQVILEGIKDLSGRVVTPEPEAQPQHLPLFYIFAETGSADDVRVVTGASLANTYGTAFLDPNSVYATHATPFIQGLNSIGNLMMLKRLKPSDASTAFIRFSLGITKEPITQYARDERGRIKYDAQGRPETINTNETGYVLKWYTNSNGEHSGLVNIEALDSDDDRKLYTQSLKFGKGLTLSQVGLLSDPPTTLGAGIRTGAGGAQEHVYPIFDLEVSHFGSYGNNLGVRIYAPNMNSSVRPDMRFFENTAARPYRIEFIKRKNKRSSATTVSNLYGESTTDFVFKPGQVNPLLANENMYIGARVLDQYRNLDTTGGRVETYGPFNRIRVYDENINHILSVLYQREKEADDKAEETAEAEIQKLNEKAAQGNKVFDTTQYLPGGSMGRRLMTAINGVDDITDLSNELKWQLDILTGYSIYGHPYRTIKVLDIRQDGKVLDENTEHWATGGSDGTMGNEVYNDLVSRELRAFDDVSNVMLDLARYPFSVFYDTGYPMDVKEDILTIIRARKDVSVALATHAVTIGAGARTDGVPGVTELDRTTESAVVRHLYGMATAFPESEVYNTGACRANIIMQCGTIIGNQWKGKAPMTYELAMKRAQYMGQANGKMKPGYGYDQDGIKQLQYMKEVNNPFVPYTAREINWTHGATWAQYYDRNTMFFPAVRTVYRDETSVLLSDINMLIATDLEKVCFRVWRRLVGNAKLTNEQFAARSDQYILEDTEGRYDSRVVIKPYTYYTVGDEQRGYSWHCEIHMYANNMKTVGVMTVVTHRMEDLEGGN